MEDFGYLREEKSYFVGLLKRVFLVGATLFSIICFIYVTINAYYYVYHDENEEVQTIQSPKGPIKVTKKNLLKKDSKKKRNISIYDDIFGSKKEPLAKVIPKIHLAPEPAFPPKRKRAKVVLERDLELIVSTLEEPAASIKNSVKRQKKDQRIVVFTDQKRVKKGTKDLLTKGKVEVRATKKRKSPRGRIKVQIAALTSKNSVGELWRKINRLNPKLFEGLKLFSKKVDLGKRGIFYRVQIGNFIDQIQAEEFCNSYVSQTKKSRADCIVVE